MAADAGRAAAIVIEHLPGPAAPARPAPDPELRAALTAWQDLIQTVRRDPELPSAVGSRLVLALLRQARSIDPAELRAIEDCALESWKQWLWGSRRPGRSEDWGHCLALLSRTVARDIGDRLRADSLWSVTIGLMGAAKHRHGTSLRGWAYDRSTELIIHELRSVAEALVTAHPSLAAGFRDDPTHARIHFNFRTDTGHFQPLQPYELVTPANRDDRSEYRIASAWLDELTPEDRMPLAETLAAMDTEESWTLLLLMVQEIPATEPEGAALRALRDHSTRAKAIPPPATSPRA